MSVLSFPRIYFKGFMEWDPCTFNNNDWAFFPTYDPVAAALNWEYLSTQRIFPEDFPLGFRLWAITPQADTNPNDPAPGALRIPCEWNMFGTHGVSFVQYGDFTSTVTGGDLGFGQPVQSDPLIGGPVAILGDNGGSPAKLVDTNPASPWSSQVLFGGFSFGSGAATFSGPRLVKMYSRWLNPFRIYQSDQTAPLTQPASSIGVCFQTCIPFETITWPAEGVSPLIDALRHAAAQPGALGVMIRFTGYVNVYFVNGRLNGITAQPRDYPSLAAALKTAWETWFQSGGTDTSEFFSNPCYSHVVGVAGVWNDGEMASVPGGRRLNMNGNSIAAIPAGNQSVVAPHRISAAGKTVTLTSTAAPPVPFFPGPLVVHIDDHAGLISLDLSSTTPEYGPMGSWPSDLVKTDLGPLTFGVVASDGSFTPVATIPYEQYNTAAYERSAGIIDIPFPAPGTGALLKSGSLAIQVQNQTVLVEQQFTAETDQRAIYLNQEEETSFDVTVYDGGVRVGAGVNVLIARYDGVNNVTFLATNLPLIGTDQPPQVNFTNGTQGTITVTDPNNPPSPPITTGFTVVTTNADGVATVSISAESPSFPVLAFYPYTGDALPALQYQFSFIDSAFYTTVRVLPFDDAAPQAFVDLWNASQDQAQAWSFIYNQILYLYDALFNVMLQFVNLGSEESVRNSIGPIWSAIAKEKVAESTSAMPVTRDLSAGKRLTLQLWIYLVANNFNVPDFSVSSIPAGWTPTGTEGRPRH
jgi:hypothetical protein